MKKCFVLELHSGRPNEKLLGNEPKEPLVNTLSDVSKQRNRESGEEDSHLSLKQKFWEFKRKIPRVA